MTIPKIIHQTWKIEKIPSEWQEYHKTWKDKFPSPEYKHILWTDKMIRDFIKENYGWFLDTFDSYPKGIQRADVIRYFLLYHYGGIYADLDCEVRENFYNDLDQDNINLAGNPYHTEPNKYGMNNLMASNKKNSKWKVVFKDLEKRKDNTATLKSTGPCVLASLKDKDVKILEIEKFNPLKKRNKIRSFFEKFFIKLDEKRSETWEEAKVVHHGSESWKYQEAYHIIKIYVIPIIILLIIIYKLYVTIKKT